jgi:hypothetical protein
MSPETYSITPALVILAIAKAAGVTVVRDGDALVLEEGPPDLDGVVALLTEAKPDLMRILVGREAARATFKAQPPPDCSPGRWDEARQGLEAFMRDGWGDQAVLLGWTTTELYRVPESWGRVDQCGAALLIGDADTVLAITDESIVLETDSGSELRIRRAGREHLR